MDQAKSGDTVQVHYTGTLQDGTVFDSSREREPLQFTIGQGQLIAGFEQAVVGLNVGESVSVDITAADAYGTYDEELLRKIERSQLPEDLTPEVGQHLQVVHQDGNKSVVTIVEVADTTVTLDANHPLAGEDLNFEIELVGVQS